MTSPDPILTGASTAKPLNIVTASVAALAALFCAIPYLYFAAAMASTGICTVSLGRSPGWRYECESLDGTNHSTLLGKLIYAISYADSNLWILAATGIGVVICPLACARLNRRLLKPALWFSMGSFAFFLITAIVTTVCPRFCWFSNCASPPG